MWCDPRKHFIPVNYTGTTLNRVYHPPATLVRGLTFIHEVRKDLGVKKESLQALLLTFELDVRDQSPNYFPVVIALVRELCLPA